MKMNYPLGYSQLVVRWASLSDSVKSHNDTFLKMLYIHKQNKAVKKTGERDKGEKPRIKASESRINLHVYVLSSGLNKGNDSARLISFGSIKNVGTNIINMIHYILGQSYFPFKNFPIKNIICPIFLIDGVSLANG